MTLKFIPNWSTAGSQIVVIPHTKNTNVELFWNVLNFKLYNTVIEIDRNDKATLFNINFNVLSINNIF